MERFLNIDEKGNFVDKDNVNLYKKYNIEKGGFSIHESMPFTKVYEYKKGANVYWIFEDSENNIIPMYYKKVNDVEIVKPISSSKTRKSVYEDLSNNAEFKQTMDVVSQEVETEPVQVTYSPNEMVPEAEIPSEVPASFNVGNDETVVIEEIQSVEERQMAFADLSLEEKENLINKLFAEGKEDEIAVLINNPKLADFYTNLQPEEMKRVFGVLYKNADTLHGKEKNDMLNDISSIVGMYPNIPELLQQFEGDDRDKFFEVLPSKKMKSLYKKGDDELKQEIDNYLIKRMVYSSELLKMTASDKDALKSARDYYKYKNKREKFTDAETALFNLEAPSDKELKHQEKVQTYIDKYSLNLREDIAPEMVRVYDSSMLKEVPFMDRNKFKYYQNAYLRKYDARAKKNIKKIRDVLKEDIDHSKDRTDEYEYMYKNAYKQHKAVHDLFKRKNFLNRVESFRNELGAKNPTLEKLYREDNPDVEIIGYIRSLLQKVEEQSQMGVQLQRPVEITGVESPEGEPIVVVPRDEADLVQGVTNGLFMNEQLVPEESVAAGRRV